MISTATKKRTQSPRRTTDRPSLNPPARPRSSGSHPPSHLQARKLAQRLVPCRGASAPTQGLTQHEKLLPFGPRSTGPRDFDRGRAGFGGLRRASRLTLSFARGRQTEYSEGSDRPTPVAGARHLRRSAALGRTLEGDRPRSGWAR